MPYLNRAESFAFNIETVAPFRARVESFNVPLTSPVWFDWANNTAGIEHMTINTILKMSLI